ncbi:S-methyl-5-thioribose-1-phosphate isomerase [Alicyclobacillus sp. ALC3]|uniref:S-methyl-5-thioribose-1-phosphate isomerase n=1 Tax=Alicyclobacillus sp. ALC3 TaxID=2796143 RepID=UPI0023788DCA|nr:S-methyl-5-thioribose-1-phosphate isomerase [Alicyclobacillus sp. ALC3]
MTEYHSLQWTGDSLVLLDQRLLPHTVKYVDIRSYQELAEAIKTMMVRGAPAIGVAAAYGLALPVANIEFADIDSALAEVRRAAAYLRVSRPTAVNLHWAIERVMTRVENLVFRTVHELENALVDEANAMASEDVQTNRAIGKFGADLVPETATVIHHCNTGALGTVDYGTALGVIRTAHEQGKKVRVFVDETRPRLQGSRLTAWELTQLQIPFTVIVDGAAAYMMKTEGVDLCVVGCDRVAANGDVANKIGTYHLALAAYAHGVPFYVAAPLSTVDLTRLSGEEIEIEERAAKEVNHMGETCVMPETYPVRNPAFDVTPAKFITGLITEKGIIYPPFDDALKRFKESQVHMHGEDNQ